jgi:hypothetical protein
MLLGIPLAIPRNGAMLPRNTSLVPGSVLAPGKGRMRHSPADGMVFPHSRDCDEIRGRTTHMRGRSDFQRAWLANLSSVGQLDCVSEASTNMGPGTPQ